MLRLITCYSLLALWLLGELVSCVSPRQFAASLLGELLVRKQTPSLTPCHFEHETDVWTDCQEFLWTFNLTLDYFRSVNPGISETCDNYVPGNTYCVIRASRDQGIRISENGRYGAQENLTSTCVGSGFGDCCGSGGYCGSGEDFCGIGNCQEGACDGDVAYSTDGRCGQDFDYLECPPKFGRCCSAFGYCGSSSDFCGTGCQSGNCSAPTSTTTSSSIPSPSQAPGGVSTDGSCGYQNERTCPNSGFGECCSAAGYCGITEYECSDFLGCQANFGTCNGTQGSPSPTRTNGGSSTASGTSSTVSATSTSPVLVPSPTQDGIAQECNRYQEAVSGDYCYIFAENNAISTAQLYAWNAVLGANGENCASAFYAGYYYCVGVDS